MPRNGWAASRCSRTHRTIWRIEGPREAFPTSVYDSSVNSSSISARLRWRRGSTPLVAHVLKSVLHCHPALLGCFIDFGQRNRFDGSKILVSINSRQPPHLMSLYQVVSSKHEQAEHFSRHTYLQAGSLTACGLGLPQLLGSRSIRAAESGVATARSCIMLYMIGGPPQHETFDMKPEADVGVRGEFSPMSTTVPGLQICEYLPRLASLANHYSLIRSVHHDGTFHATGVHYNLTGWKHAPRNGQPLLSRRDSPSIGGVLQQLERRPRRVADGRATANVDHSGWAWTGMGRPACRLPVT